MYIVSDWLDSLGDALWSAEKNHPGSIRMLSDIFNDPIELVRCYIEPNCRYQDHTGNSGKAACSAFDAINLFMGEGVDLSIKGGHQLLVLGNSGSGKTSFLSLLRLSQILESRDRPTRCELFRLGLDTLDKIASIHNPSECVLLLDGLDEDREARASPRQRLLDLLEASESFNRVVIACDNRFFFQQVSDQSSGDEGSKIGEFDCPLMVMLDFDTDQVEMYLDDRYPAQWKQRLFRKGAREDAAKQVANVGVLKHRPQLLSLIGYLFENDGPIPDEYALMEIASVQWLVEESEIASERDNPLLTIESLYEFSKILATRMMGLGQYSASEHRVLEWLPKDKDPFQLQLMAFGPYSLLQRHEFGAGERSCRFLHRSVQEFFAAQQVLDTSSPEEIVVPGFATNKMIDYIERGRSSNDEHRGKKLIMRDSNLGGFGVEGKDLKGAIIAGSESDETFEGHTVPEDDFQQLKLDGDTGVEKPEPGSPVSFEIEEGVSLDMLWVPAGSFNVGNRDSPVLIEIPQGFWLGKIPITQRIYESIMGLNPAYFIKEGDSLPVEQVSWIDAQGFCVELTKLLPEGLDEPLEFRMPKESEWVHACRAENDSNYSYGDNERIFGQYGWYSGNSGGQPREPGQKRPNPWGFHDMHGNVWEWCYDRDDAFASRLINDLRGGEKEEVRAIRGGGWSSLVYACRIANRNWLPLHEYNNNIGFRVALVRNTPKPKIPDVPEAPSSLKLKTDD